MEHIKKFNELILEEVQSYDFKLVSDNPKLIKYEFIDAAGNPYLVEFKKIDKTFELKYFVKHEDYYSVSKITNVNIYRILKTVFSDILNDFSERFNWIKSFYLVGLAKDREREYISSRTKVYKRYLDMNPPRGWMVNQIGNKIELMRE
jgi:hypothetical protein